MCKTHLNSFLIPFPIPPPLSFHLQISFTIIIINFNIYFLKVDFKKIIHENEQGKQMNKRERENW